MLRKGEALGHHDTEPLGRQSQTQIEVRTATRADAVDDGIDHARPVFQATAELVRPLVGFRAQELAQDVTMRPMQLDPVEARTFCTHRRSDEVLDQLNHFSLAERASPELNIVRRANWLGPD